MSVALNDPTIIEKAAQGLEFWKCPRSIHSHTCRSGGLSMKRRRLGNVVDSNLPAPEPWPSGPTAGMSLALVVGELKTALITFSDKRCVPIGR